MGYLFYLLKGSEITFEAKDQGNGDIRVYQESDPLKVNQLEKRCLNAENTSQLYRVNGASYHHNIVMSAHYYLCFSTNDTIEFKIDVKKVMYNTSEFEQCKVLYIDNKPSAMSAHKCCDLSQNLFRKLLCTSCDVLVVWSLGVVHCITATLQYIPTRGSVVYLHTHSLQDCTLIPSNNVVSFICTHGDFLAGFLSG